MGTGTAVVTPNPTPVQRPPEKQVQRTAHSSAVGHGLGIGGNAALYAFGTYGWGTAAAIGGATVLGLGAKHLRNRRRGTGRGGGLFGGGRGGRGGLLGRLGGGRGRSGGGLGLGGGRGRGSRASGGLGSHGSKAGGFLSRLSKNRSSAPKGGGGLLGRGSKSGGPFGRGKSGGGLAGSGRGGLGSRSAGSGRGRGGGLLGGSRGNKSRGGSGLGGGRARGGSGSSSGGRKGGLLSGLNPFKGGRGGLGSKVGRGVKKGVRRLFQCIKPGGKKPDPKGKKDRQKQATPSGWEEALPNPDRNRTKWEDRTMTTPSRRRVPNPSTGGARTGGGLTQAAEQFAGALAKPPTEVNTLKTFDADLGDIAGAVEAIQGGMGNHTAIVEAGMPAETYAHEQLRQYTRQLGQIAEGMKGLQAEARRRLALDHERVENGRPNEQGYDWKTNQQ